MYILTEKHFGDVVVIGCYTNLKLLHSALPVEAGEGYTFDQEPLSYAELTKLFKDRSNYSRLSYNIRSAICNYNDSNKEYKITYIEENKTHN